MGESQIIALETPTRTTNPKNWLTPVLIKHKPKGGYGSPSSLLRDRGLAYISKEERPQANLRRTDGRTNSKSATKVQQKLRRVVLVGQLLGFSCYDDDDVLRCLILGRFPSPLLLWYPRISSAIFRPVLCTTADHRPPQIPRVMRAPPAPLDRLHECVAIGSWTHASPGRTDGRTDGRKDCRTDGLLRERLAGWSPVLYTSFYIFGYPVQPCTEIWRYILRLFSFNIIIMAIYSRKKKKGGGWRKGCSLTVKPFFNWRNFAKKWPNLFSTHVKMKWFWKVSIGNRSEGEKIARFLCLVFSV